MGRNRISVGRASLCDIRIDERWDTVSNEHADLEMVGETLTFTDHSTNGTIINGQTVHNKSVGIYAGDKILLAGVYELDWNTINGYFPSLHRPTVTRNIRGGNHESGRKTVNLDSRESGRGHGRRTEHFNGGANDNRTIAEILPQRQENYGQANTYSQADIDKAVGKWNWGGFLCTWLWAVAHKIYWPLIILIIGWLPYAGQVCSLCLRVYLGMKGSKLAWNSGKYKDFDAYVRARRNWTIAGIVWLVLSLLISCYSIYVTLSLL